MLVALRQSRWGVAGGVCLLLLLTACGDADPETTGQEATAGGGMSGYVECLRDNGIDVGDLPAGAPDAQRSGRPEGFPSDRPSGFPSDRPEGFPSDGPEGFPSDRPTGGPGGQGPGGQGPGGGFADMLRPDGVDDETWAAAQEACQAELPAGGPGGPRGDTDADTGVDQSGAAAYRNCLAERDVEWADDLDSSDPAVADALAACEPLQPAE
ncbi:hypothetical protein O7623_21105 [Solwaraspora sp. WMMD791]|uniref:hypothetical protein n=1 Tax=Solwaraspora sp. WMMD791 TaxID=3016086 RepID=UPI00249C9E04|nr:hypothetical protein [Solwaraspora sp. WMMD791]WFE25852.1 hypothetical protein O7623_21105 [Solwaraspora sp. WMMD791]